jgi:hypothetical protein
MRMAKPSGLAFSLLLLLVLACSTVGEAQVSNGTFNWLGSGGTGYAYDPTIVGWSFSGGAGVQDNGSAWGFTNAPGATQSAFLQNYDGSVHVPTGNPSSISQGVSLTPGDFYTLDFYLEQRPGYAVNPVTVTIGLGNSTLTTVTPPSSNYWTLYTDTFVASSNQPEALTFTLSGPQYTTDIDVGLADVSLSVPEGGSPWLYLLLAGAFCFGAVVFTSRGRLSGGAQA